MRKLLVLLPILLLLTAAVLADDDIFYNGWVYPGDTFTENGVLWDIGTGSSEYDVLIEKGLDKYLIPYGSCKYSKDGLEKYCFTESDYIDCERHNYDCPDNDDEPYEYWCCPYDVDHVKYDAGRALFGAYIELSDVVPTLEITHTSDKSLLKLGEKSTVTVTLENTGEDSITGLEYVEVVPEGFRVVAAPDFMVTGNTLTLQASIAAGYSKNYQFTVKPLEYTSGEFNGNASYNYKGEQRDTSAKEFTINVPSPFIITHEFDESKTAIDTIVTYTYTIKNNDGESDMDAEVVFDGIADLLRGGLPSGVEQESDLLTWEGLLETDDEEEFEFDIDAGLSGLYPVSANATMTLDGETFTYPVQDTLTVEITELTPELRLSADRIIGGSEHVLRVLLDNADGDTDFFKIRGTMVSTPENIFQREVPLGKDSVPKGEIVLVKEETFLTPDIEEELKVTVEARGTYQTKNGELLNYEETLPLTIIPANSTYQIKHELSNTSAKPGDEVNVTVTVKNNQETYRSLSVTDSIPNGAIVTAGNRQRELSLERGEEEEVYTYTVAVPESYQSESFMLTTRVYDQQADASFTKGVELKIDLPFKEDVEPEDNGTGPIVEPEPEPEPEPEEEKGFFRKVIDGIIGFFDGLFS